MRWESYQISLWSHQETYLATLCNSQNFQKYDANAPVLNCDTTGNVELTFSIPVVVYNLQTGQLENNSLWYNQLKNSASLANEKRVKLIFDKMDLTKRRIIELVITSLQQSRNGEQLYCNVTCKGLAFKWLGKIGFSLTLDSQTILLEEQQKDIELVPTINYWLDKIFPKKQDGSWATFWGYTIDMKYNGNVGFRDPTKVYQNDDIIGWKEQTDGTITEIYNQQPIEKQRFISVQESNKYNITQDIAQEFEVFARYEFLYQDKNNPFKATSGMVIFYNEQTQFTEYVISYGNNELGLTKISQSSDIVTKMYVNPVQDEYSDTGYVALSQADANKMGQEYLFNFDYYITSGQMTESQKTAVATFEKNVRKINQQINLATSGRDQIYNQILEAEVEMNNAKDSRDAAAEIIRDYNNKVAAIASQLTRQAESLQERVSLLVRNDDSQYYLSFSRNGIDPKKITFQTSSLPIGNYSIETDQYGYATKIRFSQRPSQNLITVKYEYNVIGFYRAAISYYQSVNESAGVKYSKLNTLIGYQDDQQNIDGSLYSRYNYWKNNYDVLAQQKRQLILQFEEKMGYFIKQGKWDASNFSSSSYENREIKLTDISNPGINPVGFYPSQETLQAKSYYTIGPNQTKVYYDFIQLDSTICSGISDYNSFYITERWVDAAEKENISYYYNNAQGSIHFMKFSNGTNDWVKPVFLLQNADRSIDPSRTGFQLRFNYNSQGVGGPLDKALFHRIQSSAFAGDKSYNEYITLETGVSVEAKGQIVYRRTPINDDNISNTSIKITNGARKKLKEFQDFLFYKIGGVKTITYKINDNIPVYLDETIYPITIEYKKDHSSQQLYFDAKDVLKTSAFPQVTYQVSFSYIDRSRLAPINNQTIYNQEIDLTLGNIVRINDWDLGLKNVKGIVTAFSMDLDSPQNTSFTISNYKTKFEDLFGRIVAQTQSMKAKSSSYDRVASLITPTGQIAPSILQSSIANNSLIFSSGYDSSVTWDQNGILVQNTSAYANGVKGQVVIKGGGILLSNALDAQGNRLFTSAITPNGINASAILTGRIDTDKINIYSGDQIRFMWNQEGLFAYGQDRVDNQLGIIKNYIRYNEQGLYFYWNSTPTLSLGWDGLYIGAQDGSVELDGAKGLTMYNGPKYDANGEQNTGRVVLLHLGRYDNDTRARSYGFRLFNNDGNPTLTTDNGGNLWLRETLSVGNGNSMSGITAVQETQYNQDDTVKFSPVRFWAGAKHEDRYKAPFWVLQDGTFKASKAIISGEIAATSGKIGGWTIQNNKLVAQKGQEASIEFTDANGNISSFGPSGVSITGEINATSGTFSGTINATGGNIGNLSIADISQAAGIYSATITSSQGFTTTNGKSIKTVLTTNVQNGVILQNGRQYTYTWEISDDRETWSKLTKDTTQSITINIEVPTDKYVRSIAEKDIVLPSGETQHIQIKSEILHFINIVTGEKGLDASYAIVTPINGRTLFTDIDPSNIELKAIMYVGSDEKTATYQWKSIPENDQFNKLVTTDQTISIPREAVLNASTIQCIVTYSNKQYTDSIVIYDQTEPIISNIISSGGDKFTNDHIQTDLTCQLWNSNGEVDLTGTLYDYIWYKYEDNIESPLLDSSEVPFTGKTISLTNNDVKGKLIAICKIKKKSETAANLLNKQEG